MMYLKLLMNSLSHFVQDIKVIKILTPMKENDFISDSVIFMYYTCHKVTFRRGGVYIDFSD